jgi:predicted acetyltransferase
LCGGNLVVIQAPLDGANLCDEAIELRLIRVLEIGDMSRREPDTAFLSAAPEYRFAIHRRSDNLRIGRIHVRIADDPGIVEVLGHMGYAVDEEHRRQGYAARAIRLMTAVANRLGQHTLWVLIERDNIASCRAIERAGFELVDEIDTREAARALGLGPRLRRYRNTAAVA